MRDKTADRFLAVPKRWYFLKSGVAAKSGLNHIGPAAGTRIILAMEAGDIESLLGAGQSHIKQAPVFLPRGLACRCARGSNIWAIEVFFGRPRNSLFARDIGRDRKDFWIVARRRRAATIGKN